MNIDDLRIALPEFLNNPPVTLNQSREEVQELFDKLCLLVFNDERDKIPHYVLTQEEYGILKEIGFNNISDFSGMYDDLTGLPKIPSKVEDLEDGIDYATKNYVQAYIGAPIPRRTSELENDMGYITSEDIPAIPIRVSELENDAGYITGDEMDELFNGTFQEDGITRNDNGIFPKYISRFTNDVGYARSCDVINCVRLSELYISFGAANFESTLLRLVNLDTEPEPVTNIIYKGVCYNAEVLNLFGEVNDCFIEIKTIERTPNKVVYEINVTNLDCYPYRYVRLYEFKKESESFEITNRSPQWNPTSNILTENRVKEIIIEVLREQGLIR